MILRRACAVATLVTMVTAIAAGPRAVGASDAIDDPSIEVVNDPYPDDVTVSGATFKVEGTNWPANTLVQLEVCGNEARAGSSDCAIDNAQIVASNDIGYFQARLGVIAPPSICPCVIRAINQATGETAVTTVKIPGVPEMLPGEGGESTAAVRRVEVSSVALTGADSFGAWMGGHPQRTLEFTVVNTGDVRLANSMLALTVGPTDDPTGFVKPVALGELSVGDTRTYRVPVQFEALSYGKLVVNASITGTTQPTLFSASTSSHPWLLIAIPALILLQLLLLLIRNIARRRLHRRDAARAAAAAIAAAAAAAAVLGEETDTATADQLDALPVVVPPDFEPDDCIICVIEVLLSGAGEAEAKRNMTVVRGLDASRRALEEGIDIPDRTGQPIPQIMQSTVDVVSILGVEAATIGHAHEASVALGQWVEAELGLQLCVSTAEPATAPLFRCGGVPATINWSDPGDAAPYTGWSGAADAYSSVFFSESTESVDLHGLVPLAVYSRPHAPAAATKHPGAAETTAHEARKIRTMLEMFDSLLAEGECSVGSPGNAVTTRDADPTSGSASVSSEPPENTA